MEPKAGFYSLIQYVPDAERAEGANVGVVLVCPGEGQIQVVTFDNPDAIYDHCLLKHVDGHRFISELEALAYRLRQDASWLETIEDIKKWGQQESDRLVLLPPRRLRVRSAREDANKLFKRLVAVDVHERPRKVEPPDVEGVFLELGMSGVEYQRDVYVPILYTRKHFHAAFAYVTDTERHLVHPHSFPATPEGRSNSANSLAVQGRLLYKFHDSELRNRMVLVASFTPTTTLRERDDISNMLREHDVIVEPGSRLDLFRQHVEARARPMYKLSS